MNRLLRKLLLWCARNPWLGERLPKLPFMQKSVRRFMPGDEIEDALGAAVDLQVLGIGTLYTKLGEAITDAGGAQAVADHYLELLGRIQGAEIDGEISVKPTQLGLDVDEDACFGHLRVLAAAAEAQGSYLWIDMEGSAYVDRTLDLYQRLRASHANTGICLQAYLRRTAKDVERLLPLGPESRTNLRQLGLFRRREFLLRLVVQLAKTFSLGVRLRVKFLFPRQHAARLDRNGFDVACLQPLADEIMFERDRALVRQHSGDLGGKIFPQRSGRRLLE